MSLQNRRGRGFTLVELLVVIAIVAVLALTAFMFARKGLAKAASTRSLSRLRQSGALLLADAQEKNGRMQYAVDASDLDSPYLPYNIVRTSQGIEWSKQQQVATDLCEIMHWDPVKLKPIVYPRNCFGVNFTTIPDVPEGVGVKWNEESIDTANGPAKVRTLVIATVNRPDTYPFLLDSSNAKGEEFFSIREEEGGFVGLRNSGFAHGCFLDGSARQLDQNQLQKAGFTKAFDNTTTPPKLRKLY